MTTIVNINYLNISTQHSQLQGDPKMCGHFLFFLLTSLKHINLHQLKITKIGLDIYFYAPAA